MNKNKILFLFFILFLLCGAAVSWAAAATVTNNGNITVRVQYKTPDGQYEDLGYVRPGETVNVPGGVEKVRIVRDPGKWAEPLKPGEVIDVVVKEGDKTTGTMTWYGDKVFFDGLSEGPPPVVVTAAGGESQPTLEPKSEITPPATTEKTETGSSGTQPQPEPSNWPWYGDWADSIFFLQLFLMWPLFLLLWWRNMNQSRFYLGERWVDESEAGWGWGWNAGGGCGRYAVMVGLVLGLVLGAAALWGHSRFPDESGFVPLFGQDLYAFSYFLFSLLHLTPIGLPDVLFIMLFWVLLATSCGALSGVIPLKWLYAAPCFLMILPFFLFMRGCAGSQPFGCDGGYEGGGLYPPAFASFAFFPMLVSFLLDWVDPYYEMDEDEEEDVAHSLWDFFHGNPFPLLVVLAGGCVSCFYGVAYEYGWDFAIGRYFHDAPLMLGLNFIPPVLMIILFWMLLAGVLGWSFYFDPMRFAFYCLLIPAFLALLFLTMGNYPQRNLDFYRAPLVYQQVRNMLAPVVGEQVAGRASESGDTFADGLGLKGLFRSSASGRDIQIEDIRQGDHRWQDDRYKAQ